MEKKAHQVLLYYKYTDIKNPEKVKEEQRELCESLNLKGRIIIAHEGINGTVGGRAEETEKYIEAMRSDSLFKDIVFKKAPGTGTDFPKLSVRVRPEIVTAHMPHVNPARVTGKYLKPEELNRWFDENREFYIVDMRNDYEYQSGYFEGSIFADIHNFYELPNALPKLEHLKGKTVVTVCTGGVRCEKASGFLLLNGFKDVYQLEGGIQTYMEKYPNEHFKGKLYVFDNRLTIGFNTDDKKHEIVGSCFHCGTKCDAYVNCEYDMCHYHYISCSDCKDKDTGLSFCKQECKVKYLQGINLEVKPF
jgi:UPF0176 protein